MAGIAGLPLAWGASRRLVQGAPAAGFDYDATPVASAGDGLRRLIDGNARFVAGEPAAFDDPATDRGEAAGGQRPFAVIVGCSDARVPPEQVFDQALGRLFVVRTAGQALDEATRASVSYGVDVLKAPLVVVLGHSGCGAVEVAIAAVQGHPVPGYAHPLAEAIGPAVRRATGQPGDLLDNAVRANVALGVERLSAAEPTLAPAVANGTVAVAGAVYDLASGAVEFL